MAGDLNLYGDKRNPTVGNFGVDIAQQRADDLDMLALQRLANAAAPTRALDVGSAGGGQAIRMADVGATVVALDIDDYAAAFAESARKQGVSERCSFARQDIARFDVAANLGRFDVIVCQRMIHYVPFQTAIDIVRNLRLALNPDGRLYLSASGLHSELGNAYPGATSPLEDRYVPLAGAMVEKHAMHGPICLYSVAEVARLLETAGMRVEQVFASPFGNIKAVAR